MYLPYSFGTPIIPINPYSVTSLCLCYPVDATRICAGQLNLVGGHPVIILTRYSLGLSIVRDPPVQAMRAESNRKLHSSPY